MSSFDVIVDWQDGSRNVTALSNLRLRPFSGELKKKISVYLENNPCQIGELPTTTVCRNNRVQVFWLASSSSASSEELELSNLIIRPSASIIGQDICWAFDNLWVGKIDVIQSEEVSASRNSFLPMMSNLNHREVSCETSSDNEDSSDVLSDVSELTDEATVPDHPRWRTARSRFEKQHSFCHERTEATASKSPLQYFQQYFPCNFLNEIAYQTNLYAHQKDPASTFAVDCDDVEKFMACCLYMGLYKV